MTAALAWVAAVLIFGSFVVGMMRLDLSAPAEDRGAAIAASSQRIVALHRALGIDPVYDPVPAEPEQVPQIARMPAMTPNELRAIADGHPMAVYTCPKCDWMLASGKELATSAFERHWCADHADRPSTWLCPYCPWTTRGLAEEVRVASEHHFDTEHPS